MDSGSFIQPYHPNGTNEMTSHHFKSRRNLRLQFSLLQKRSYLYPYISNDYIIIHLSPLSNTKSILSFILSATQILKIYNS